jgi:tyrosyl-DNA phosphodiesterase 2
MAERTLIFPAEFDRGSNRWRLSYFNFTKYENVRTDILTFVTFNTWFGNHYFDHRFRALMDILKDTDADIIGLQEMTHKSLKHLLKEEWVKKNYFISDLTGTTIYPYGVVLLSRIPVKFLVLHPLTGAMERQVLIAEFHINGQKLLVGITHLESLRYSADIRSVQLDEIFTLLEYSDNSVLMGDFNFCSSWEENSNIDNRYSDIWKVLRANEPGYTEDTEINLMRQQMSREEKQVRFDRIICRSSVPGWKPTKIHRLGMKPISPEYPNIFPSDHFGLFGMFEWCSV